MRVAALVISIVLVLLVALVLGRDTGHVSGREGKSGPTPETTLVIVTFDGVRTRELFEGAEPAQLGGGAAPDGTLMPYLMEELAPTGSFIGMPGATARLRIGNPSGMSLANYQAIFSGRLTLCTGNECEPPSGETLLGRIRRERDLPRESIAMFATWDRLCRGIGADEVADATCDPVALSERATERFGPAAEEAWKSAGSPPLTEIADQLVLELGVDRLRDGPPAVLYLAFDDSDATGHRGDYPAYLDVLRRYDTYLRTLVAEIDAVEAAGTPVLLVVTTDHGRGHGDDWTDHGWTVSGTEKVWLFARGPGVARRGVIEDGTAHSHLDLRPTIEYLLGLEPVRGLLRGEVIEEILAPQTNREQQGLEPNDGRSPDQRSDSRHPAHERENGLSVG